MKELKLTVEPVPVTSARKSLSILLPKSRWDKIRKSVYAEYSYRCAICSANPKSTPVKVVPRYGPKLEEAPERYRSQAQEEARDPSILRCRAWKPRLECHEVWEYDEENSIQRLSKLLALCTPCHRVKHWEWAATKLRPPSELRKEGKTKEAMQETRRLFEERMLDGDMQKAKQYLKKGGSLSAWRDKKRFLAGHGVWPPNLYRLDYHFIRVNGCDPKTLAEHVEEAAELCFRRSQRRWEIDFGELTEAFGT